MTNFNKFWQAYPKRNNKKVGKYPCSLWFKAEKPTGDEVQRMVDWLTVDNGNRAKSQKKFYAELPDPIRFLKNRMWEDPIDSIVAKKKQADTCCLCPAPWTTEIGRKKYCGQCNPNRIR